MKHQPMTSGVWGRSTPIALQEYVIFTVAKDLLHSFTLWARANSLNHKALIAHKDGKRIRPFIINSKDYFRINRWLSGQENTIHLGTLDNRNRRPAYLYYYDGRKEYIGNMTSCPRDRAEEHSFWIYDYRQKQYFICA